MSTPGIELSIDKTEGSIWTYNVDPRETSSNGLNSSYGEHNVQQAVNLYDGNWHNIMWAWSMDDGFSFPAYGSSSGLALSALRKGVLAVDGYIIGNETTWAGKQTPTSFLYDEVQNLATFLVFGGNPTAQSSTAYGSCAATQGFAGFIQRAAIWDRVLSSSRELSIHLNAGYQQASSTGGETNPWYWGSRFFGGDGGTLPVFWDALSGTVFKSFSGSCVAYWKFDEGLTESSIVATDWSGTASPGYGSQVKPDTGNPLSFFGAVPSLGDYILKDYPDVVNDGVMQTGYVAFEDENGVQRRVGFINYDTGMIVLDNEYKTGTTSGWPILFSLGTSGMTVDSSVSSSNFWLKKINFTSQEFTERLILNVGISGADGNISENPSLIDVTTGESILDPSATYPTTIGLYNDYNDLVAVAKFNRPIRKDEDHNINAQIKFDF